MSDPRVVIEGDELLSLIEDLVKWEAVAADWYEHMDDPMWDKWWLRPKSREARRQSVVYSNCLATVESLLQRVAGREEVNRLMEQARQERRERLAEPQAAGEGAGKGERGRT